MNRFLHTNMKSILIGIMVSMASFLSPMVATGQTGFWTDEGNYDEDWPEGHIVNDIYEIRDAKDLAAFARTVNGNTYYDKKTIKIVDDIDLSAHYWKPIGYSSTNSVKFVGTFDGGKYTISNIHIDISSLKSLPPNEGLLFVGFFSENNGLICNTNLQNIHITGTNTNEGYMIGGLVGYNNQDNYIGQIEGCSISGMNEMLNISIPESHGFIYIGGICGNNGAYCSIKNCIANIPITFTPTDGSKVYIGGITGESSSYAEPIIECHNKNTLTGRCDAIGGIIGQGPNVESSSNSGNIANLSDDTQTYAGGICGKGSNHTKCSNTGDIKSAYISGGIVGSGSEIYYCYNTGSISVTVTNNSQTTFCSCGGISGTALPTTGTCIIQNCYNSGNVELQHSKQTVSSASSHACVSGILATSSTKVEISNCYNTGNVVSSTMFNTEYNTGYSGGIFGGRRSNTTFSINISNCYNTGEISYNSSGLYDIIAAGISSGQSNTITNCLVVTQNINHPFICSTGGKEQKGYRICNDQYNKNCENNYANAPMLLQIGDQISVATENIAHNDMNGANWQETDNTSLPISNWPDKAWDKSNNAILPQLKYEDGLLMPEQPNLLKSDFPTETPSEPEQPASSSDATLKSLSYKIGEDGQVTPVPNFSPDVYQYEIGYKSNEDAIAAGEAPLYPDGTRVYPIGVATNEKAQVLPSDMLLPYGFAKVGVTSEDKSTDRTYSLFMMSEKDAGKKYYLMMNLEHLTLQINGEPYNNSGIYKANHNEEVTVKLIPDQGYKLPNNMVIDNGCSISFFELDQTGEIKLGEISWHMDISVSAIKDEGIEDNSFAYNGLKYQIISDNTVSLINLDTNYGSNWDGTTCTIPATVSYNEKTYNVTEIARSFYGFDLLKEIHIPASVTMIHLSDEMYDGALTGNELLEKIIVDAANPAYTSENGILYDKNKTTLIVCPAQYEAETLILPTSLKRIESEAFMYCVNIRNLVLPEGLTHVFDAAFAPGSTDPAWESITLPSTIKFLGDMLFDDLDRGLNIYCRSTNPANITLEDHPFADVDTASVLYVPKGCKAKYQAAEGWKEFKQIIEEGEDKPAISFTVDQLTYTVIGQNEVAISGVTDKTPTYYNIKQTVTYQNNVYKVTTVGKEAFKGCTNLVRFNPESIRMVIDSIGEMAFDGCSKLSSLIFSEGLETIGNYAFNGCTSLGTIDIPASVTHIGEGIFDNCSKLSQIRVKTANKHYSSSNGVLYNKDMTTLLIYPNMRGETYIIPQGVTQIENFAFYTCTNLKSVTLPEGLESIGEGAFDGCTGLKSLTLPASVKRIGLGMVDNCEKTLEEIHSLNSTPINLGDYPEYTFFYYSDKSDICKLYVPRGSKGVYSKAPGWKDFKQILEEGENPPLIPNKADEEIILNTDSTYTDSKGNICHFNGMVGNGEEETVINKLTIKGSATSTTATITFNQVAVGNGSNTGEATTNVTNNTNVTIELIGDNSLGKLVNDGITKLISKLNATLNNTVVVNNGTFVDETGLLTRVEGVAELDITAPTDQEVLPGENVPLTASAKVGVTYTIIFVWEQLQLDGTWKTVGSPNIYTPARSGLRSTTIVTDRLIVHSNDAGKYRCVIRNKVGEVSSTLTTSPITVTTKNSVDIITPKYNRKLTIYGNQLHFEICVPTEVYIINLNGSIFRKISLPAGDTYIDGLDKGIYILLFKDGQTEKVRI